MKTLGTLLAGLAIVSAAPAEEKKADFDASKLEGKWKFVSGEKYGEKVDAKALAGDVTITKDTITLKGADMTHVLAYKLDAKATPVVISMTGKEGAASGMETSGIIELKGDDLKLCYAFPGEKRPTEFAAKKDTKNLYFVLKRIK
jgi:uncharacterized protein (TIGR03067 family)